MTEVYDERRTGIKFWWTGMMNISGILTGNTRNFMIKYPTGAGILSIAKRAAERRKRIVANRAAGFAEAEEWDLRYWQSRSPEERLGAFAAIRNDAALIKAGKKRRISAKQG